MYKRIFTAAAACLLAGVLFAQAYRWVDEDGVVHYSDRPHPGAEEIELSTSRPASRPRTPPPSSNTSRRNEQSADEQPDVAFSYESLAVSTPGAEETLWNIEGVLNVTLELRPALRRGDQVRVYFDGEQNLITRRTSFQVEEVYRGVHNIQVEVVDQAGTLMIRSQPNRFYVQQNTIAQAN
jgi:hypothetical protein